LIVLKEDILLKKLMPMLAKPGKMPRNHNDYGFEVKWDGIRALAYITDHYTVFLSRNLKDISRQYPELSALNRTVDKKAVILDGEIVALGDDGKPSFACLQHRMGLVAEKTISRMTESTPVTYMIFDILYYNTRSLEPLPYTERRQLLESLSLNGDAWQTPAYYEGTGPTLLKASKDLGLEGIVAKRLDSSYEQGKRTGAWIKIKNQARQELVIAGWVPGSGKRSGRVGSILTGYYDVNPEEAILRGYPQRLIYAGKVGTGFSDSFLDWLQGVFTKLRRPVSPFSEPIPMKDAIFVEPRLVGKFEFTEWTRQHTLRHPSFKGMHADKEATQVVRETN
jgi:bifunctional non-homologous end joining protein LigD